MLQFAYTTGKNSTDSALIIDAMDLLYSGNVDAFAHRLQRQRLHQPRDAAAGVRQDGLRVRPAQDAEGPGQRVQPVHLPRGARRPGTDARTPTAAAARADAERRASGAAARPARRSWWPRSTTPRSDDGWAHLGQVGSYLGTRTRRSTPASTGSPADLAGPRAGLPRRRAERGRSPGAAAGPITPEGHLQDPRRGPRPRRPPPRRPRDRPAGSPARTRSAGPAGPGRCPADAVAEVEDVTAGGPAGVEDLRGAGQHHLGRREHQGRVEVALHRAVADQRRSPSASGVRQSTPTTSAPASPIRPSRLAVPDPEVDARHAELAGPRQHGAPSAASPAPRSRPASAPRPRSRRAGRRWRRRATCTSR